MLLPRGLAVALGILLAQPAAAEPSAFRIHDHLDENEVEETTSIYVDGELVQVFRLTSAHTDEFVELPAPPGKTEVAYVLCGRITVRRPDGTQEVHDVDGSGVLTDVQGRDFDAVAALDFTLFYLTDITAGRPAAEVRVRRVRSCAEALS
jgi:hypothetical protein